MPSDQYDRHVKPLVDLALLALALPLWLPLLALVAAAVRRVDGAPVLFRQRRVGRHGLPFTMLKFRTLKAPRPGLIVAAGCPDLTRLGLLLRRTGLDELPQVANILAGEMSLVGPRPVPLDHPVALSATFRPRLAARPGVTGLAQLAGRSRLPWPERLALDRDYIARRSLLLDLWILARTPLAVLAPAGGRAGRPPEGGPGR